MSDPLNGKVAIVTGGTRGIGHAIAETLVNEGCSVAVCGRSGTHVDQAVSELTRQGKGKAIGKVVDVGNNDAVSKFFETVDAEFGGRLDILVNNAGVGIFRSVEQLTVAEWQTMLRTNLDGVFYCSHEAIPRMKRTGGGHIVNMSSLAGKNAFAGGAGYNASKFGLNGFSEAMMLDHRNDNVRVSYIMPGSVNTEFSPSAKGGDRKIAPQDVADVVLQVLTMPERTLISRVEMRPSKPPQ
jgi:NADP-dependent 3-hydroxy acid dehydrogenase YdfG